MAAFVRNEVRIFVERMSASILIIYGATELRGDWIRTLDHAAFRPSRKAGDETVTGG
jgi:hypothetical protein